jgi:hypothetical protein
MSVERRLQVVRAALGLLAIGAAVPGVWAASAPRSFYDHFPGAMHWVDRLPPYNEHLAFDAGAFFLAFALLFTWGTVRPHLQLVLPACAAWILFGALHLAFHLGHLEHLPSADAAAQTTSLLISLGLPVLAVWALPRSTRRSSEPSHRV